jgi:polyhydroxyalkanoate synthesis regulator phasin
MLRHTIVVLALVSVAMTAPRGASAADAPAPQSSAPQTSAPQSPTSASSTAQQTQSVEEIRDTVINLLNALVQRGVLTREQAQAMVADAQTKAEAAAKAREQQEATEQKQAIRVPYVPQIVKDEISKQVESEIKPQVVQDVVNQAKTERWGIPGALPEWMSHVRPFGDVTLRAQNDSFSHLNPLNYWLDFNAINAAGGIAQAGQNAFLNVSIPQNRLRVRARIGVEGDLTPWLTAVVRLGSGNLANPVSEWQTLGQGAARYTIGIDQAYLRVDLRNGSSFPYFTAIGGRMPNPWFQPTNLIFYQDLAYEGFVTTGRLGLGDGSADQSHVFGTLGAFPILHVPLQPSSDKWLLGGQLGYSGHWDDQRLVLAAAYYDFLRITGVKNPPDVTFYNFTQPVYIQFGNTYYEISNSTTNAYQLFGLAANFHLISGSLHYQLPLWGHILALNADWVENIGYNVRDVLLLTGINQAKRNIGDQTELVYGYDNQALPGHWRAIFGYRYLQRDAVMDGWTDSDFHLGGTNARGYYLAGEYGFAQGAWVRLKYWGTNTIDGPDYIDDSVQLDVNARF